MDDVILKRFSVKWAETDSGCWQWHGSTNEWGYGLIKIGGKTRRAHRMSYEHFVGPIADGLQIDHLCRNRACVNPAHLEAVTPRVNTLRSRAPAAANARKTHCPRGHPYDEVNTYVCQGKRECRACWAIRKRARKQAAQEPQRSAS